MKSNYFTAWIAVVLLMVFTGCGIWRSMGENPQGEHQAHIDTLPNYKNGAFHNLTQLFDTIAKPSAFYFFRSRPKHIRPPKALPSVKTDLKKLTATAPNIVWFGHSSLLIKTEQGTILTDPIFSNHAGPVPGFMKAFAGTMNYRAQDMPPIDVLIISHDHYDHLDFRTLKKLKNQIKIAVVPVGVGADLRYWGFDPKKIVELNWNQSTTLPGGLQITATPAQHKSNRTYSTVNKTLWASFVIQAGSYRLFYGGDGGYGDHFKQIGKQYGPFDIALLECGQYSPNWPWTHLLLGVPAQAAADLQAKMIQPIHWAKFPAADHPWTEPIKALLPAAEKLGIPVNAPRIGELYTLGDPPKQKAWWDLNKASNN